MKTSEVLIVCLMCSIRGILWQKCYETPLRPFHRTKHININTETFLDEEYMHTVYCYRLVFFKKEILNNIDDQRSVKNIPTATVMYK